MPIYIAPTQKNSNALDTSWCQYFAKSRSSIGAYKMLSLSSWLRRLPDSEFQVDGPAAVKHRLSHR